MITEKYNINLENYENSDTACLSLMCHEQSPEMYIKKRPLIMVIPGGGYEFVSDREADPIAASFYAAGYNTAILTYSVAPFSYPVPYLEAFAALKLIITNAEKFNVLKDQIFVCGFSAGGHLAGLVGTGCNDPFVLKEFKVSEGYFKIAGMILSYPVINGGPFAHRGSFDNLLAENRNEKKWLDRLSIDNRVIESTPRTFIWSTFEDGLVPCENTMLMCDALRKRKVPFELHIFEVGNHGLSLADDRTRDMNGGGVEEYCSKWMDLCLDWLKKNSSFE